MHPPAMTERHRHCKRQQWLALPHGLHHGKPLLRVGEITLRVPILAPKSTMLFTLALSAEVSSTSWYTVKDSTPTKVFWIGDALPGRVVKRRRHRPSSKGDSVGAYTQYLANHASPVVLCPRSGNVCVTLL